MGYPGGEIPMLSVHGLEVAGATFAVPIWHLYMAAAEARRPVRNFLVPKKLPALKSFYPHHFGYLYVPTYTPAPAPTPKVKPGPPLPPEVPKPTRPVPATKPPPPPPVSPRAL
jgi:hypothetical protein